MNTMLIPIVIMFLPFFTSILLYLAIFLTVYLNGRACAKLLKLSFLICLSNMLITIPEAMLYLGVQFSYVTAQVILVTLYYTVPLCDCVVYYFSNPTVIRKLSTISFGPPDLR